MSVLIANSLYLVTITIFFVPANGSQCSFECPSARKDSDTVKSPYESVVCYNDSSLCGFDAEPSLNITNVCRIGRVSFQDTFFTMSSVEILQTSSGRFLHIRWRVPAVPEQEDHRNFPSLTTLKLLVSSVYEHHAKCFIFSFSFKSLALLHGHFHVPCVEINTLRLLKISSLWYVQGSNSHSLPVREQQVEISTSAFNITPPLPLWSSDVNWAVENDKLFISFVPSPKFPLYTVTLFHTVANGLCDLASPPLYEWKGNAVMPIIVVEIALESIKPCKTYCVQVATPTADSFINCTYGCSISHLHTLFIHIPSFALKYEVPNCNKWNASMAIQHRLVSSGFQIYVFFVGCCGTEHCFSMFEMFLLKLQTNEYCNDGRIIAGYVRFEKENHKGTTLVFNVTEGNYCVKVRPRHEICERGCNILNSDIVSIHSIALAEAKTNDYDSNHQNIIVISAVCVLVIVFFVAIGGVLCWRLKRRRPFALLRPSSSGSGDSGIVKGLQSMASEPVVERVIVFTIHTYDQVTKHAVKAMIDVMKQVISHFDTKQHSDHDGNTQFELVDEDPSLPNYGLSYMELHSKPGAIHLDDSGQQWTRRVIVAESRRAIAQQQQYEAGMASGEIEIDANEDAASSGNFYDLVERGDEQFDRLFMDGLQCLTSSNRESRADDYRNLFVVRFDGVSPKGQRLQGLVPAARYYLPEDMLKLIMAVQPSTKNDPLAVEQKLDTVLAQNAYFSRRADTLA